MLQQYKDRFRSDFKEYESEILTKHPEDTSFFEKEISHDKGIYNYIKNKLMCFKATENLVEKLVLINQVVESVERLLSLIAGVDEDSQTRHSKKEKLEEGENIKIVLYYFI